MKGTNTLELNTATMVEALQEYVDARWTGEALRVVAVRQLAKGNGAITFEVTLGGEDPSKAVPLKPAPRVTAKTGID